MTPILLLFAKTPKEKGEWHLTPVINFSTSHLLNFFISSMVSGFFNHLSRSLEMSLSLVVLPFGLTKPSRLQVIVQQQWNVK